MYIPREVPPGAAATSATVAAARAAYDAATDAIGKHDPVTWKDLKKALAADNTVRLAALKL